jgi:hypothetical protein
MEGELLVCGCRLSCGWMVGLKNKGNEMNESGVYQIITPIGDMFLTGRIKPWKEAGDARQWSR